MRQAILRTFLALSIVAGVLIAAPVQAAHPLITDDTGTQGKRKFLFELNGEVSLDRKTADGVETREDNYGSAAAFTFGATDNVDIIVGLPWTHRRVKKNGTTVADESGIGDLSLEAKWRFFSHEGFSLAVKPGIHLPTGDADKGLGNGKASYGVTLIAALEWERYFLYANAAYLRNDFQSEANKESNRKNIWRASFAAGLEVFKGFKAVANLGMESNEDKRSNTWPAFLLGGVIYSVTEKFDVDLGVKWGLSRPEPDLSFLAGIAWRFE